MEIVVNGVACVNAASGTDVNVIKRAVPLEDVVVAFVPPPIALI